MGWGEEKPPDNKAVGFTVTPGGRWAVAQGTPGPVLRSGTRTYAPRAASAARRGRRGRGLVQQCPWPALRLA
eukprot:3691707-Rhodomonas_salina.1